MEHSIWCFIDGNVSLCSCTIYCLQLGGGRGEDLVGRTLRASLFGTFLQILPDLVTPLKGYFFLKSPRSCPATRSAPSK